MPSSLRFKAAASTSPAVNEETAMPTADYSIVRHSREQNRFIYSGEEHFQFNSGEDHLFFPITATIAAVNSRWLNFRHSSG